MSVTDREVAVEVLGMVETVEKLGPHHTVAAWKYPDGALLALLPSFTQDVAAAMTVVAQMERDGWRWSAYGGVGGYNFTFYGDGKAADAWKWSRSRFTDTLPQAICEAAVAAVRAAKEAQ